MSDIEYEDEYSYEDEPEESMDWNSADEYSDQEQYSDEDQEESMDRGSAGNAHDYKSHSVGKSRRRVVTRCTASQTPYQIPSLLTHFNSVFCMVHRRSNGDPDAPSRAATSRNATPLEGSH